MENGKRGSKMAKKAILKRSVDQQLIKYGDKFDYKSDKTGKIRIKWGLLTSLKHISSNAKS